MRQARLRAGALLAATAVGGCVYGFFVRPRISRWGATDEEVEKRLPGRRARMSDGLPTDLDSGGDHRRAAPRGLAVARQMGSGRADFYTHDWVERLLFVTYGEGHSAIRIHPEWQQLGGGDRRALHRPRDVTDVSDGCSFRTSTGDPDDLRLRSVSATRLLVGK